MLVVLSGPSAVGKNHLLSFVAAKGHQVLVPTTSRPRRDGEVDGQDYHFLSVHDFQTRVLSGSFAQWDYCLGAYYGCGRDEVAAAVEAEEFVFLHALARIACRLRAVHPGRVHTVLMKPGGLSLIDDRLEARGYEAAEIEARRRHGDEELLHAPLMDQVLERADSEKPSAMLTSVIQALTAS
jgi:guanylate kinase